MTCTDCGDRGYIVIGDRGFACVCEAAGALCPECLRPNETAPFKLCRECKAEADAEWSAVLAD